MSKETIEALLGEASRLYNDGDYRNAIQKWEEVLVLDPNNQKAKESIKIAGLLSDTWAEPGSEPGTPAPAAEPSAQEQQIEEGLARIRAKLETRDFRGAHAECEALEPIAAEHPQLKSFADQARSGLEAEPFIKAALERAQKELKASNFEMVELLCSKIVSLDASNRDARMLLYMAQRRTTGEETPAQPAPGTPPPTSQKAPPAPEPAAASPEAPAGADSPAAAAPAPDPLAEIGMEADFSPLDLVPGDATEEPAAPAPTTPSAHEAPYPSPDAGALETPPAEAVSASEFEHGEQIDASIKVIPLAGPRPEHSPTRSASELIQDGSIYEEPDPDGIESTADAGEAPQTPAAGAEEGSGPLASPGSGDESAPIPLAEVTAPPPGAEAPVDELLGALGSLDEEVAAGTSPGAQLEAGRLPKHEASGAAAAPSRSGGWFKIFALIILLLGGGAGAAFWYLNKPAAAEPQVVASTVRPDVAAAASPKTGSVPASSAAPDRAASPRARQSAAAPAEEAAQPEPPSSGASSPVPPDDPEQRMAQAQARYAQAQKAAAAGDLHQAQALLFEALEVDPMLFEAKDLLDEIAQRLIEEERFEVDLRTVRRAIQSRDYHSALWKLYRMQEAFPEIREWDRNIADAWYNWGVLLLKAGNCREAIEKFDEVAGIFSSDHEAIRQRKVAERYLARPKDVAYHSYVDVLDTRPFTPIRKPFSR
ncbi:MAG: hypothetical protein V3U98_00765 [Acidobacteriota bacterium]